jgi:hypothetical protein
MKTPLLLLAASCGALALTGCTYDDDDGYHSRSVTISSDSDGYYGDFDEYSPYYSYSGRRYYRTGNRYVYYSNRRPYYVTTLPSSATYITPRRTSRVVVANEAPYYNAVGYDEYSPYYSYSGRRYYRTGNRYVYYNNRRPSYVTSLPSAAVYVTPTRTTSERRVYRTHSRRVYDGYDD